VSSKARQGLLPGNQLFLVAAGRLFTPPGSKSFYATGAPQHFLYFLPLPQGQGSLRPIFGVSRR
jgi:hypothetical protein